MADPNWANVDFLYSFDGVDGATTFTDQKNNTTASGFGGVALSNAQSKWGTTSLDLDGTDDAVEVSGAILEFTGDYTIELWWRPKPSQPTISIIMDWLPGFYSAAWKVPRIRAYSSGVIEYAYGNDVSISSGQIVTAEQWYHIAVVRESGTHKLYIDGDRVGSTVVDAGSDESLNGRPILGRNGAGANTWAKGYLSDVRVTPGVARYTGETYTVPTEAFASGGASATEAYILFPSPLDPFEAEVSVETFDRDARILLPSPLDPFTASVGNDFSSLVTDPSIRYVMRVTGSPAVEIPISSWQATLQTDRLQYLQCVVPAATQYLTLLSERRGEAEIVIYRVGVAGSQDVESEMARAPLSQIIVNSGPRRETATVSGYANPPTSSVSSSVVLLKGIRSMSQTLGGNSRARAEIDWFLRPGQEVSADGVTFTAGYINYFVPTRGDAYMDVGSRG